MLSVAKEDLEILKKRKLNLIFILGGPGTGKGTQCDKIVNEFKFIHISTGDLIRDEIKKKTKLGEMCASYTNQGSLVPFELIISLLVKSIASSSGNKFLIDGFPRSMEQALYLEKHIKEIKAILNIYASEEISVSRILKRGASSGRADDKQEVTIRNRLREFKDQSLPVIEFYRKYGIVRDVNSEFEVNQVYEIVKKQLYPAVYCIIGKKYSGKTTLANVLNERMGLKVIDFKDFINEPSIAKRKNDDLFVISSLAARLREEDSPRVILEDFPMKKEYFSLFVKNCKPFEKIFYLNANDNESFERMNKLGYNHPNYIGCAELNKRLFEFSKHKDLIEYLRKQANLSEINVNNHLKLVIDEFVKNIQPTILLINNDTTDESSSETKNELSNNLTHKFGFEIINVRELINESVLRFNHTGREINNYHEDKLEVPFELILESIKPVLFKESNNKYILEGYPNDPEFINQFESAICKIHKLIYVSGSRIIPIEDKSIELYFKKSNKLFVYNKSGIDEYIIDDILGKNRNLSFVYGMPQSGKTSVINHLKEKYNFTIIDFVHLINELKTEKGKLEDPPAEPENVEFTYPELIEGFSKKLNSIPLNQKICFENIFNELVVEVDQAKKILEIAGRIKTFYEINYQEEVLIDRYKHEQSIEEDLTEDQKAAFDETLSKPRLILEHLRAISNKIKTIYTHSSVPKSLQLFDEENGKNIISIKHDYEYDIDNTLLLFAARQQALFVNVPNLIYQEFYNNTETAHQLQNSYHKKSLRDLNINIQSIYHKYSPIHFDGSIVDRLIIRFINENSAEMEEHGNFVILTGYLNNDLLEKQEIALNLPLLDVMKLMDLGCLSAFFQYTNSHNQITIEETEVPEKIIIEVAKPPPKDPLDIDDGQGDDHVDEPQENEADSSEVPKFKPELYAWTNYDGNPRNYIQTIKRMNKFPLIEDRIQFNSFNHNLMKDLEEHINEWKNNKNDYSGLIRLTKIEN